VLTVHYSVIHVTNDEWCYSKCTWSTSCTALLLLIINKHNVYRVVKWLLGCKVPGCVVTSRPWASSGILLCCLSSLGDRVHMLPHNAHLQAGPGCPCSCRSFRENRGQQTVCRYAEVWSLILSSYHALYKWWCKHLSSFSICSVCYHFWDHKLVKEYTTLHFENFFQMISQKYYWIAFLRWFQKWLPFLSITSGFYTKQEFIFYSCY
jgi:hypothetical protein